MQSSGSTRDRHGHPRKQSNSSLLDFADALDTTGSSYDRRLVPKAQAPQEYDSHHHHHSSSSRNGIGNGRPYPHSSSTTSLPQSISSSRTLASSTTFENNHSSTTLSASAFDGSGPGPDVTTASMLRQPSFSDARRAMLQGRQLQREPSNSTFMDSPSSSSNQNRLSNNSGSTGSGSGSLGAPSPKPPAQSINPAPSSSGAALRASRSQHSLLPIPPIPTAEDTSAPSSQAVSRQPSRSNLSSNPSRDPSKPRLRSTPHLHNFPSPSSSSSSTTNNATAMHWSRAPTYGAMPGRGLKSHSTTVIEESGNNTNTAGATAWVFGGTDDSRCYNDVWCLDLESMYWSHPTISGDIPPPCRAHSATVIAGSGQIIVFGGGNGSLYFNHLYILDTNKFKWTAYTPLGVLPPPRRSHTCISYAPTSSIYIFGGGTGSQALGDLWMLDMGRPAEEWEWVCLRANPVPLLPGKGKGGNGVGGGNGGNGGGGGGGVETDVYERAAVMDRGGIGPNPRGYHTASVVQSWMIVVGGSDGDKSYDDIWIFDLESHIWKEFKPFDSAIERPKILGHSATVVGFYLFIIGGHNSTKYTNDVRLLNLITKKYERKPISGRLPSSRGYHSSFFTDSRVFLIGGYDGSTAFSDVYVLDLASQSYLGFISEFGIDDDEDDEDDEDEDEEDDGTVSGDGEGEEEEVEEEEDGYGGGYRI